MCYKYFSHLKSPLFFLYKSSINSDMTQELQFYVSTEKKCKLLKRNETIISHSIHAQVFMAALFMLTQTGKSPHFHERGID